MSSLYLSRLSADERKKLVERLLLAQSCCCFICEKAIDLKLHKDIDIDHIIPTQSGGKDDPFNFALTHASCNRSKQSSHLEVARVMRWFEHLKSELNKENKAPNLGHILERNGGGRAEFSFRIIKNKIEFTLSSTGDNSVHTLPIYQDTLSGFCYFFAEMPIQYLKHDERINPRAIGGNIRALVEEFYLKRPQLHIPLAWISDDKPSIFIFDGQHKAAAQIMLGIKKLPVRVFINPDSTTLITANTNAGTNLKQVAFDKSVQRHLGHTLYQDRLNEFRKQTGREADDLSFSERDLVTHFRGQSREVKRYILDAVRDAVTNSIDNKLRVFIDNGGRGRELPLSYSSIDKTFYSFFVFQEVMETPLNRGMETGENPREIETSQIIHLMNIVADEIYNGKFNTEIGTNKIESRLQSGEMFPLEHLRSFRVSKEEVLYNWLKLVRQIALNYFINLGIPMLEEKLFQYQFDQRLWANIRNFIRNFINLPLWVNKELSETTFGGKQNYNFWQSVFESGKTPAGVVVMSEGLNLNIMIK